LEVIEKDLPQLIVGLDSLEGDANYIHILDAKENVNYYCPCCGGIIKPRAYKKGIDYQVQPHYYHETGGCSNETYIHFICKTWLFKKGCKFIINNIEYEVDSIETEKTLHTSFGNYRPDIIVATTDEKVFFFEIKTTNKKTELYVPKWDELGNDVVEVDTRYFINQKFKNDIPIFNLIYSDGECFIKSYSRADYEDTIAKRKQEWKRQDKLNYKIQWEKLDWFWENLRKYKLKKCTITELKHSFMELDYTDKIYIYLNVQNKSCIDAKISFEKIINKDFIKWLETLKNTYDSKGFQVEYYKQSERIYILNINYCKKEFNITVYSKKFISKKKIWIKEDIENVLSICQENSIYLDNQLHFINDLEKIFYIEKIVPHLNYIKTQYDIDNIYFKIYYQGNIYNKYVTNRIGIDTWIKGSKLTQEYLNSQYQYYLSSAKRDFYKDEFYEFILNSDKQFMEVISLIKDKCDSTRGFSLEISDDYRNIRLYYRSSNLIDWYFDDSCIFGEFEKELLRRFMKRIDSHLSSMKINRNKKSRITRIINRYGKIINNCNNKQWTFELDYRKRWIISLFGYEMYFEPDYSIFPDENLEEYIKQRILEAMKILHKKLEIGLPFFNGNDTVYPKIRIMEEK
jgi:hypothetical protein